MKVQDSKPDPIARELADLRCVVEEFARGYAQEIEKLTRGVGQLSERSHSVTSADLQSRLEALELWKGKVHGLLVEVSPTGREKPTKRGRTLGALLGK